MGTLQAQATSVNTSVWCTLCVVARPLVLKLSILVSHVLLRDSG